MDEKSLNRPDHSNATVYNCPGSFWKRIGLDSAMDQVDGLCGAYQAAENPIFPNDGLESMEGLLRVGRLFDDFAQVRRNRFRMLSNALQSVVDGFIPSLSITSDRYCKNITPKY
jgi:hypothetical protein